MSNFFDDDDGFGPARIPDRPERPRPKPLDEDRPRQWVPLPEADPNDIKPPKRIQIDHVVRRLLPVAGIVVLILIAVQIANFVLGVYR